MNTRTNKEQRALTINNIPKARDQFTHFITRIKFITKSIKRFYVPLRQNKHCSQMNVKTVTHTAMNNQATTTQISNHPRQTDKTTTIPTLKTNEDTTTPKHS